MGRLGGVGVCMGVVASCVLLVVNSCGVLGSSVFAGFAWFGFPWLMVGRGLGLMLMSFGWVGWCGNLAFTVGDAGVS